MLSRPWRHAVVGENANRPPDDFGEVLNLPCSTDRGHGCCSSPCLTGEFDGSTPDAAANGSGGLRCGRTLVIDGVRPPGHRQAVGCLRLWCSRRGGKGVAGGRGSGRPGRQVPQLREVPLDEPCTPCFVQGRARDAVGAAAPMPSTGFVVVHGGVSASFAVGNVSLDRVVLLLDPGVIAGRDRPIAGKHERWICPSVTRLSRDELGPESLGHLAACAMRHPDLCVSRGKTSRHRPQWEHDGGESELRCGPSHVPGDVVRNRARRLPWWRPRQDSNLRPRD